jgi:APA family basic amino acid/polyamine antiporter
MMPASKIFKKENNKLGGMPTNSAVLVYALSMAYLLLNQLFLNSNNDFVSGLDISEISICVLYLLYIILYVHVIQLWKKGEIKNIFLGLISPILASIGSLIIFSGACVKLAFILYAAICIVFILAAFAFYKKNADNIILKTDEEYQAERGQE